MWRRKTKHSLQTLSLCTRQQKYFNSWTFDSRQGSIRYQNRYLLQLFLSHRCVKTDCKLCTETNIVHHVTVIFQFEGVTIQSGICLMPRLELWLLRDIVCHSSAKTYQNGIDNVAQADEIGVIEEESYNSCSWWRIPISKGRMLAAHKRVVYLSGHSRLVTLEVVFLRWYIRERFTFPRIIQRCLTKHRDRSYSGALLQDYLSKKVNK